MMSLGEYEILKWALQCPPRVQGVPVDLDKLSKDKRLLTFLPYAVDEQTRREITSIRSMYFDLTDMVIAMLPECRHKSIAITHLEDSYLRSIRAFETEQGTPNTD